MIQFYMKYPEFDGGLETAGRIGCFRGGGGAVERREWGETA